MDIINWSKYAERSLEANKKSLDTILREAEAIMTEEGN